MTIFIFHHFINPQTICFKAPVLPLYKYHNYNSDQKMTDIHIQAPWSPTSEYYIDMARGSIYHSKTASRGQSRRIFADGEVGGRMKHFSYPQATDLFKKTKTGEFYLILMRNLYGVVYAGPCSNYPGESSRHLRATSKTTRDFSTIRSTP